MKQETQIIAFVIAFTTMFCIALLALSDKIASAAAAAKTREPVSCASEHYNECMGIMTDKYLSTSAVEATQACTASAVAICTPTKADLGK